MFGLGLPLKDAVRTGVFIHGLSGDLAAKDIGEDGMTAQDILDYLPATTKHHREDFVEISENLYQSVFIV
jgi:NAD(P)H-hydrate epimerase